MGRRERLPQPTDRLVLGASGLRVSPTCLGTTRDPDTVLAAFDVGANFFFLTADLHWPYYAPLREGLSRLLRRGSRVRDDIVVAGVAYAANANFITTAYEDVLRDFPALERIDVAVVGGALGTNVLARLDECQRLRDAQEKGVRAIGASFHDRAAAAQLLAHDVCDIGFVRYNPSHTGAREDLFPALAKTPHRALAYNFKSTMGWLSPPEYQSLGLSEDFWQPRAVDAYRFALTRPELDGLLFSPMTPKEVEEAAAALAEGPLDDEEEHSMLALFHEYAERQQAKPKG